MDEIVGRLGLDLALQSGNELWEEAIKSGYDNMLEAPFRFNFEHSRKVFWDVRFRELMKNCIHKLMFKCRGEKIGITFSGGIDSTIIAWMMKTLYPNEDIVGYFSHFRDPVVDELKYAKEAAEFIGIPLVVVDTSREKQLAQVDEATRLCSTITVGIVQMSLLGKAMAEDGVKHVIWGLGPGELVGGLFIDQRWYKKGIKKYLRLYPFANTKCKWDRYVAILFGTKKAFLINKLMKTPNKRYVNGSDYKLNWVYDQIHDGDLWSSLKKWQMFRVIGKMKAKIDCVKAYGMESHMPCIEEEFVNYCLSLFPEDVYNKKPIREWMREIGFPESITKRGEDYKFGSDSKAGLSPSDSFYDYDYVKHIVPEDYESMPEYIEYFTDYVKKNMLKWMKIADRRAMQIGLFLRMMKHRRDLNENDG